MHDIPKYIIIRVKMNDVDLWRSCGLEQYFDGDTGYAFVKINPDSVERGVTLIAEKAHNSNIIPNTKKQIDMKRFMYAPAFACTPEKGQGRTIDRIVVDVTAPKGWSMPKLYVALSRVKQGAHLRRFGSFTPKFFDLQYTNQLRAWFLGIKTHTNQGHQYWDRAEAISKYNELTRTNINSRNSINRRGHVHDVTPANNRQTTSAGPTPAVTNVTAGASTSQRRMTTQREPRVIQTVSSSISRPPTIPPRTIRFETEGMEQTEAGGMEPPSKRSRTRRRPERYRDN